MPRTDGKPGARSTALADRPADPMLDLALHHAALGRWVFPLQPGRKTPHPGTHGHLDATRDEATIRRVWVRWPGSNVGWVPELSGEVLIDLDVKGGQDGPGNWARATAEMGVPDGPLIRTTSGGAHLVLRGSAPTSQPRKPDRGADPIGEGVDIRGVGGYGVAPGSRLVELRDPDGTISQHAGIYEESPGRGLGAPEDTPAAPEAVLVLLRSRKGRGTAAAPTAASLAAGVPAGTDGPLGNPPGKPATAGPYELSAVEGELAKLAALRRPWAAGAGWDTTVYAVACNLTEFANSSWAALTRQDVERLVRQFAPTDDAWGPSKVAEKIASARQSVGSKGRPAPRDQQPADPVVWETIPPTTAQPAGTAAGQVPNDQHATAVALAVEGMLVRYDAQAEFRIRLAEREPVEPFDAGLLGAYLGETSTTRYRADGLVLLHGSTVVSAKRKTGKTTFVVNLAHALLTGEPFLGQFEVERLTGRVAVLNYEVTGGQFAHWADRAGVPADRMVLVNLRGRPNPLGRPTERAALAEYLRQQDAEMLVVDPFSRAFIGESQNDVSEVGKFLNDLDLFARAEVGATDLLLTVHTGWNAERSRGSSGLEDWPDSIIRLTTREDDETGPRFMSAMGRDVEVPEDQLELDPIHSRLRMTGSGSRKAAKQTERTHHLRGPLLGLIGEHPGSTGADLARLLRGLSVPFQKGQEHKALQALAESGEAVSRTQRNARHWYLPGIAPEPLSWQRGADF